MKKILSFILCALMVLTIVPVSVIFVSAEGEVSLYANEFDANFNLNGGSKNGDVTLEANSTTKGGDGAVYYLDTNGMRLGGGAYWTEPVTLDNNSGEIVLEMRYYNNNNRGTALSINGVAIAGGNSSGHPTIGGVVKEANQKAWRSVTLTVTISDLSTGVANVKSVDTYGSTYTGTITLGAIEDTMTLKLGTFDSSWRVDYVKVTQVHVEEQPEQPGDEPEIPTDLFSTGAKDYAGWNDNAFDTYTVTPNGTDGDITVAFTYVQSNWQGKAKILTINGKTVFWGNGKNGQGGYSLGDDATKYETWSGRTITVVIDPTTGNTTVSDGVGNLATTNVGVIGETFDITLGQAQTNSWKLTSLAVTQSTSIEDSIYTVTFMLNGSVYKTIETDGLVVMPEAPQNPGSVFGGWRSDDYDGIYQQNETVIVTKDTTFWSLWSIPHEALYQNNFSSSDKVAEGDDVGSGVTYNDGKLAFAEQDENAYWSKTVDLNGTDGMVSILFSLKPNLQSSYSMLTINGVTVLSAANGTIVIGEDSHEANIGYNQDDILRNVAVAIDIKTGEAMLKYYCPVETQDPDEFVVGAVNIGEISENITIRFGVVSSVGNDWRIDDLLVDQEIGEKIDKDDATRTEYDYYKNDFSNVSGSGLIGSTIINSSVVEGALKIQPTETNQWNNAFSAFPDDSIVSFKVMLPELPEEGQSVKLLYNRATSNYLVQATVDEGKNVISMATGNYISSVEMEANEWYTITLVMTSSGSTVFCNNKLIGTTASTFAGREAEWGLFNFNANASDNTETYYIDDIEITTVADDNFVKVTGYQKTGVDGGKYNVRFIASIVDLYEGQENIGFEITAEAFGKSWGEPTTTVYNSITANFGTESVEASELGGKYVTAYAITGIPADVGEVEFVVKPYVTINGIKVYGSAVTVNANPITNSPEEEVLVKKAVLLLGQSNMAGRGDVNSVEKIDDDRIYMMRNLTWMKMEEPIFTDKVTAGVGPAASFAKAYVETYDETLGLIPGAVGGTSLAEWAVGGTLYNNAVAMANKAIAEGTEITAILWHQGEADTTNNSYSDQLKAIIDALYVELGLDAEVVPFITGELFEQGSADENRDFICYPTKVNQHLASLADDFPLYAVVSGKGFRHIGDQTHLDAPSARVLGYRYFEAYYELVEGTDCPYEYSEDLDSYLK